MATGRRCTRPPRCLHRYRAEVWCLESLRMTTQSLPSSLFRQQVCAVLKRDDAGGDDGERPCHRVHFRFHGRRVCGDASRPAHPRQRCLPHCLPVLRCKGAADLPSSCAVPAEATTPVGTFFAGDAWLSGCMIPYVPLKRCLVHASEHAERTDFGIAVTPGLRPAGQLYSLNDARQHDWPEGLRRYIDTIRQGRGQNPKQYSARYVCSLVRALSCLLATPPPSWPHERRPGRSAVRASTCMSRRRPHSVKKARTSYVMGT